MKCDRLEPNAQSLSMLDFFASQSVGMCNNGEFGISTKIQIRPDIEARSSIVHSRELEKNKDNVEETTE